MNVSIVELSPVIYCGTAGGGPNEYAASDNPNAGNEHILDVPVPAGHNIVEAWYAPLHNIPALNDFALVDVSKHNDRQVRLTVGTWQGRNNRVRLKISVLCAAP
ncbi:hypothetical protein [Sorangium sp. So ce854]|uniref:hypothetical protein n=1 Tax=Sorangium sp. So ce854 TaxID=3133322 RepID=UPI003F6297CB